MVKNTKKLRNRRPGRFFRERGNAIREDSSRQPVVPMTVTTMEMP